MSKKEYIYSRNLLSVNPCKEVKINKKGYFGRLICNHNYQYLVREEKNQIFSNPNGDVIEQICISCGKSKGTMFWEYEGMGYK